MAEVVLLTYVGKAVASKVITILVNRAFAKFDEYRTSEGMTATKEKLEQNLPHIQAVLQVVDRGQIKDQNVALDKWLWQLRGAVEEAEDAIDELDYYKLKEKVNNQADLHGGCTASMKKKISKMVKCVPAKSNYSLKRLKLAVEGLCNAAAGVSPFLQIAKAVGDSSDSLNQNYADTGAMLTESKVFGRNNEKELIFKWLCNPDAPDVSAFSIVGMGGLGKTTLARVVYNEIKDNEAIQFSPVIWVSVSDIFRAPDPNLIIKKVLQDITKTSINIDNLTTLQDILKKEVTTRKFFLVFDNVWQDDQEAMKRWEQIMAPLKWGQKGSRILVTTRVEDVANMISKVMKGTGEKNNRLLLGGLEEHEFLKLFNKQVFGAENPEEHKNLQQLAKQVVRKLKGSPLAVRVIDNLLNDCNDIHHWERIARQDISKILIHQNEIIATLKLSYHHLTEDAQQCFRYCSLFPQEHKFKRDELIKMWIGSGLIHEDAAEIIFDTLVRKSFFHISANSKDFYLMHDFMHEMAVYVSSGECLRTNTVTSESIPETIRHLSIVIHSLLVIREITPLKHLQSLFIEYKGEKPGLSDMKEFEKTLKGLKSLRLLSLTGDNLFQLPTAVGHLIHLRYIFLQQTTEQELDWLPQSTYRLYHLEMMAFLACGVHGLTKAKLYGMGNLISLRYLHAPSSVIEIIPDIGKLTSLQKLELFGQETGRMIGELGGLKNLSELKINSLDKLKDPEKAKEAKIHEKDSLCFLSLNWSGECTNSKLTLANLEAPNQLKKLHISGYCDDRFPDWITNSILNLVSLELRNCAKCNTLPPLGKLHSLQYLLLSNFPKLELINSSFYGKFAGGGDAFPSLKELRIIGMSQLEKWVDIERRRKFPRLDKFVIEYCPKLTTVPALPVSIRDIEIKYSGLQTLPVGIEFLRKLRLVGCEMLLINPICEHYFPPSLEELIIEECGNDEFLACSIQNLSSLTRLELTSCRNIISLPQEDIFLKLTSLREICVQTCTKLSDFGGLGTLTSLRFLKLSGCDSLVTIGLNKSSSDTHMGVLNLVRPTLKIEELHIDHCSLLLKEPLRSLCLVKKLHLLENYKPESLPKQWLENCTSLEEIEISNACALKGLPSNIDKLTDLKKLIMHQAILVESLPQLPTSLSDLVITGCNDAFKQRYKKDTGSNWNELADLTTVIIQ